MFDGCSYIAYLPLTNEDTQSGLEITMTFLLSQPDGLLLFTSLSDTEFGDHLAITVIDRRVHYRYSLGANQTRISSPVQLELQAWHTVTITLEDSGSGALSVNNEERVFGVSTSPFNTLNVNSNLWLGGFTTFMDISSITGITQGLSGCVAFLSINNRPLDLIIDAEFGFGVSECNTSSCDGDPCFNDGVCIESGSSFVCECLTGYGGSLCATMEDPCVLGAQQCSTGSTCQITSDGFGFTCLCPLGREGDFCEQGEFPALHYVFQFPFRYL